MTAPMPLIFPILVSLLSVSILAMAYGMVLSWRALRRQNKADADVLLAGMERLVNRQSRQIEALIASHALEHAAETQILAQNVETIQSDIEWMAGEKMIEQAMTLVRGNAPLSQISRETGLTHETIRTLASFRTH